MWTTLAFREMDDGIAVGVRGRNVERPASRRRSDARVIWSGKRDHGQCGLGAALFALEEGDELLRAHAAAHVVVCDDQRAGFAKFSLPPEWSSCQCVLTHIAEPAAGSLP